MQQGRYQQPFCVGFKAGEKLIGLTAAKGQSGNFFGNFLFRVTYRGYKHKLILCAGHGNVQKPQFFLFRGFALLIDYHLTAYGGKAGFCRLVKIPEAYAVLRRKERILACVTVVKGGGGIRHNAHGELQPF